MEPSLTFPYDLYNYQEFWKGRDYDRLSEAQALKLLLSKIVKSQGQKNLLLDAGSGYGRNAVFYGDLFQKAILLDPSEKKLKEAAAFLKGYPNLFYQKGLVEDLPFKDDTFDSILCVRVFHHLPDWHPALLEFTRTLKPGGFLILELANKLNWKSRFRAFWKGDSQKIISSKGLDKRSPESRLKETIPFVNHNPKFVADFLQKQDFFIREVVSVSNFRSPLSRIKPFIPFFVFLDRVLFCPFAKLWFGPSIIFLAQKKG